jgi:FkbM family methyltransferase
MKYEAVSPVPDKLLCETRFDRLWNYFTALRFAIEHAGSLVSAVRLYYLAKLKPSLVYRGFTAFNPERICVIPFRVAAGKTWNVYVRDNGQDAPMVIEFFKNGRLAEMGKLNWKPRVIYDLGANIGIASLSLSTFNPDARIYGFEPVPANFDICQQNYSNLSRGKVLNCAVGFPSSTMSFEFQDSDLRGGHLTMNASLRSSRSHQRVEVEVWSVADLIDRKGLEPPDVLKVDVEGAELDVLLGLGTYANSVKCLHIETHSLDLRNSCANWLEENGFKIIQEFRYPADMGALWAEKVAFQRASTEAC